MKGNNDIPGGVREKREKWDKGETDFVSSRTALQKILKELPLAESK